MPNMDKTGPSGAGPLTGRHMGECGDGSRRGETGCVCRRGHFSRFSCRRQNVTPSLDEREKMLKEELQVVENRKEALKNKK